MRKLSSLVVGTALAGALAAGVVSAPAQAATASTASTFARLARSVRAPLRAVGRTLGDAYSSCPLTRPMSG
jgi:hypothetical protein